MSVQFGLIAVHIGQMVRAPVACLFMCVHLRSPTRARGALSMPSTKVENMPISLVFPFLSSWPRTTSAWWSIDASRCPAHRCAPITPRARCCRPRSPDSTGRLRAANRVPIIASNASAPATPGGSSTRADAESVIHSWSVRAARSSAPTIYIVSSGSDHYRNWCREARGGRHQESRCRRSPPGIRTRT